eukprot:TRINITY_DN3304_c0_g1_i10.p1 TRINITY_DN3304_c0_g1~~TRINITY_DN3304_c0_g1_i10.p1  ORF type:complete len:254 (-),score=35.96 TRINITY_DN3304_c0_g1_i10:170-931(-)
MHVHGGGWQRGDKSSSFYGSPIIAKSFSSRGILCLAINYRTSTAFPTHVIDVARALKWVTEFVSLYGGDPDRIFLSGHSSGGHLVSLLATDHRYLCEVGLSPQVIKGVISISGIYSVGNPLSDSDTLMTHLYRMVYVTPVFGNSHDTWTNASPCHHVQTIFDEILESSELSNQRVSGEISEEPKRKHLPPFLLFNAMSDMGLDWDGKKFFHVLQLLGVEVDYKIIDGTDHASILTSRAVHSSCVNFVQNVGLV